jgi:hypothetical protein
MSFSAILRKMQFHLCWIGYRRRNMADSASNGGMLRLDDLQAAMEAVNCCGGFINASRLPLKI